MILKYVHFGILLELEIHNYEQYTCKSIVKALRPVPPIRNVARYLVPGTWYLVPAEMNYFFHLKLSFWRPWGSFLGTWDTILVILGSRGTPNGHTEAQRSSFIDFRVDLGSLLGFTLGTNLRFSVILGGKMGDSFQVHVCFDPGMEMMPECNGCMWYKHGKNCCF